MEKLNSVVILILIGVVCFMGYLLYNGGLSSMANNDDPNVAKSGLMKTETDFRDKMTELRMQRDKVNRGIKRLEKLKSETIAHLREKGINSGDDFLKSDDKDVKFAVTNLKEYAVQIAKIKKEVTYYDEAISGIGVMLDRIERERVSESVSLSEEEYLDLQKIIVDLNERLDVKTDILEEEELKKLLDLEMTN